MLHLDKKYKNIFCVFVFFILYLRLKITKALGRYIH